MNDACGPFLSMHWAGCTLELFRFDRWVATGIMIYQTVLLFLPPV